MKLSLNRVLEVSRFIATQSGKELEEFITYVSDFANVSIGALRNGLTFKDNMNCKVVQLSLTSGVSQVVSTDGKRPVGAFSMNGGGIEWSVDTFGNMYVTGYFGGNSIESAGSVKQFAGAAAPSGYLICDGAELDRVQYALLFSVIGTTYGSGDGSTTFNIPDLREAAIAGIGTRASGVTAHDTFTLGQFKDDQSQGHKHVSGTMFNASTYPYSYAALGTNYNGLASNTGDHQYTPYTSGPIDNGNGTPRTGTTTRGKRLGMNHIISTGQGAVSKSVNLVIMFE